MRILWVSRYAMVPAQVEALRAIFGAGLVVVVAGAAEGRMSAQDILQIMRINRCTEVAIVAPLSVIASLVALGIRPLCAKNWPVSSAADADYSVGDRHFRFVRWRRVASARLEFTDLIQDVP